MGMAISGEFVKWYLLIGAVGGVLLGYCAFVFAGAGHGSYLPAVIWFGPIMVLSKIPILGAVLFWSGPLLYVLYGYWIWHIHKENKPRIQLGYLFFVHFGSVVIALVMVDEESKYFDKMMSLYPEVFWGGMSIFILLMIFVVREGLIKQKKLV